MVARMLRTRLSEHVEQRLRTMLPAEVNDMAVVVIAQLVVGAFLALLQWWTENEMPLPPEQMDAYFRQLVLPGIQQIVAQKST